MKRWRVRPSAASRRMSRLAAVPFTVVAALFVLLGVTVVIPSGAGAFGYVWTGMACCFLGVGLFLLFSRDGTAHMGVDVEEAQDAFPDEPLPEQPGATAAKLEELQDLYVRGLITREEYDEKKQDILSRM